MSDNKHISGEVSWSDNTFGNKQEGNSKDLFLRLTEGDNELRIITSPFQYQVHLFKQDLNNPKDFGQKIQCSLASGSCPICQAGGDNAKIKTRWFLGVIDRKTQSYKILDISYAVFSQIKKLSQNAKSWGNPTKYDVNIFRDSNGGSTGYYSVQPLGKEPLTAIDQQILDKVDLDDLKRRVTPPDASYVQRRLDKLAGLTTTASTSNAKPTVMKAAVVQPSTNGKSTLPASLDDDTDNVEFPPYNSN